MSGESWPCLRGPLRRVLQESGVRPGGAIVIGDEIRDIAAARAVGIPFGAVAWDDTLAVSVPRLYGCERCHLQHVGVFPLSATRQVGEHSSWSETAFQQPLVF
jgi:hypothetical protein